MREPGKRHVRLHGSLLAAPEKRLLVWMAERIPSGVGPDHLSLLGLAAMLGAGLAFWAASWERWFLLAVVGALFANWLGDSLDGTLARVRRQERPRYGFYVDHVIDIVGALFLVVGMALSGLMSPLVALSFLVAYLMVSAESYLATHTHGVFRMSLLRIGPTELRILLAVGVLWLLHDPWVEVGDGRYLLLDVGGIAATVALGAGFVASAARNTVALYRAERLPVSRRSSVMSHGDDAIPDPQTSASTSPDGSASAENPADLPDNEADLRDDTAEKPHTAENPRHGSGLSRLRWLIGRPVAWSR